MENVNLWNHVPPLIYAISLVLVLSFIVGFISSSVNSVDSYKHELATYHKSEQYMKDKMVRDGFNPTENIVELEKCQGISIFVTILSLILFPLVLLSGRYQFAPYEYSNFVSRAKERKKEIEDKKKIKHNLKLKAEEERNNLNLSKFNNSKLQLLKLSDIISNTESELDIAEKNFKENAFSPFWDSIGKVLNNLAFYNEELKRITTVLKGIDTIKIKEEIESMQYPFAQNTINRMSRIINQAQKDFHFASIYEQRLTNKILIMGFSNVADAINNMNENIQDSIDKLENTVSNLDFVTDVQVQQSSSIVPFVGISYQL